MAQPHPKKNLKTHTTWWYKDLFTKISYGFTWLIVLVLINIAAWVMIEAQQWLWSYFLLVIVFVWIFWNMWRTVTLIRYTFTPESITLHLPGKKTFILSSKEIVSIESNVNAPWWYGWGVKIHIWSRDIACTTASTRLMRVTMSDGKRILISPRIMPPQERYPQWK
jgi:hypothetical protein